MRLRTIVAGATVSLVVGVLGSVMAPASGAAPSSRALPPGFQSATSVPWATVGTGWLLAQWTPSRHATASYLILVSPTGKRFVLMPTPGSALLEGWSGDGQRALLSSVATTPGSANAIEIVNLRTAQVTNVLHLPSTNSIIPEDEGFTKPNGLALGVDLQVNGHQQLTRYGFDGVAQTTFPGAFRGVGKYTGSWISSPDGTKIVMGAGRGLAVVDNNGAVVARLPISPRTSWCQPQRWWGTSVVLARCGAPSRLYEFNVAGGTPRALTRVPVAPDSGDLSAWHVGHAVYVQVASACGYIYLAKLDGHDPVLVHVPGVPVGHTIDVVGATSTAVDALATPACQAGASLIRYTPSGNRTSILLGRPATAGQVDAAFIYPTLLG